MTGLRPIPLLGARVDLLRFFTDPIGIMQRIQRECGRIGSVTRGSSSLIVAIGPEFNRQLLTAPQTFHHAMDAPFRIGEDSTLMSLKRALTGLNGDEHRHMRRLMMPAFSKVSVAGYRDDMVAVAERHLARWHAGKALDMTQEMTRLALDVMMKTIFGLDSTSGEFELGQLMLDFLGAVLSPQVLLFPFDMPGAPYRRMVKLSDRIHQRILGLIEKRRARDDGGKDVLSLLIRATDDAGARIDDNNLVAQASMLFSAGHETTAATLSWTLFLLTQHPQVYRDLVHELERVLAGAAPTVEHFDELPLLSAVIKESMRLIPSVPALFVRKGVDAFELGGYHIPAGAHVVLSPLLTHRLPELYPDAETFRPERWQSIKPSIFEYLPFGAGPRLCLGASFAELELRLVLAMIVQRFRLALLADQDISYKMHAAIMNPRRITMRVYSQDRAFEPGPRVKGNIVRLCALPGHGAR